MNFGSLSILIPWILAALLALPALWWLLRLTPPSPKRIRFPAIGLLLGLRPREETPHRTPWWLILLRIMIAALIILALSHPVWNAGQNFARSGHLLLVVDNGWAAAPHWEATLEAAGDLIDQAEREDRTVFLMPTAPGLGQSSLPVPDGLAPVQARSALANLAPQSWPARRDLAAAMLADWAQKGGIAGDFNIVWLSDGVAAPDSQDAQLLATLAELGDPSVMAPRQRPLVLRPARVEATAITARIERSLTGAAQEVGLRVLDGEGRVISTARATFAAGDSATDARIVLPLELRGRVSAIALEQSDPSIASHAAAVTLFDDAAGSRPIGVITDNPTAARQPLLGELYYVERALLPFNELRVGNLATLVEQPLAVMILPDATALSDSDRGLLDRWVKGGGMLIRFSGERLSVNGDDGLLPVRLRQGDRVLGGALSWSEPSKLAAFPTASPFAGLAIPDDVAVARQVLAEPDLDLGSRTWARLNDGTPLVTGAKAGDGHIVLFHVSANAEWSNLALSGLFVEMLDRLLLLAAGVADSGIDEATPLPPSQLLDGFGRLVAAPSSVTPLAGADIKAQLTGPLNPPGLYGPAKARRALNLSATLPPVTPLGIASAPLAQSSAYDWKPWLLLLAALLLAADCVIALALRGLLRGAAAGGTGALGGTRAGPVALSMAMAACGLGLGLALAAMSPALAQDIVQPMTDDEVIAATETTRLAYVRTGIPNVDATSHAGLTGLTTKLLERTSTDVGTPVGIDLNVDTLDFYPVIYWPITASGQQLSDYAVASLNRYLAGGGLILIDTADQNVVGLAGGMGPGAMRLQEIAGGLDMPPLVPVPAEHVLTRAFYLLKDFPGRWVGGTLWVETPQSRINDGVASVVVGSNDFAAAWAMDDYGQPLFPVTPGGERQREMAYRFGINLVMYALTGNYKSDQVHVPAILERLGQ